MRRDSRGLAASVEAALLLPVLMLFVALVATSARIALTQQALDAIAAQAARAATLQRAPADGRAQSLAAVDSGLREHAVECLASSVEVDATALAARLGATGEVSVVLGCTVALSDVSLPLMPGSYPLRAEASSPVDRFRQR